MDLGWNPKSPLDILHKPDTPNEGVNNFKARLKAGLEDARYSISLAKARQSAYSSQKYEPASYAVGDEVWLHKSLFRDSVSRAQESKKLSARRFGPFEILECVGKNAVRVKLPDNVKIYDVLNVIHTIPHKEQPADIARELPPRPEPIPDDAGDTLFVVDCILRHRRRGRGFQFLTLMKGAPQHEAQWQPTRDFVDADGTLTAAFRDYIVEHNLLVHLH